MCLKRNKPLYILIHYYILHYIFSTIYSPLHILYYSFSFVIPTLDSSSAPFWLPANVYYV